MRGTVKGNEEAPPDRVDLRSSLPRVRDQGMRGTCVAFAITSAHEVTRVKAGTTEDLAEEVLYWGCKQIDGEREPGTTFVSAASALERWGQPAEELWPYDDDRDDQTDAYAPPDGALSPEVCHRASLRRVESTIPAIRMWLAAGYPVVLGVRIGHRFMNAPGGRIPLPETPAELVDGHAMVVVGYEDGPASEQGHLIVRNSWGVEWGDAGYGYLPYSYLEIYGGETWVIDARP